MRLKNSAYYDRGEVAGRRGRRSESFEEIGNKVLGVSGVSRWGGITCLSVLSVGSNSRDMEKCNIQELDRPPPEG